MNRAAIIVLVALGAAVAGVAIASRADLGSSQTTTGSTVAAGPQQAKLSWRETYGQPGEQLVFTVDSFAVTADGWTAHVGVENKTRVAWKLVPDAVPDGTFGISLFRTGDSSELDQRNQAQTLPAVREATSYHPQLEPILEPKAKWEGEISARGALVAGSWVRVVFGTLVADGKPPSKFGDTIVWITDSAYQLRQ